MADRTSETAPSLAEGSVHFALDASPLTTGTCGLFVRVETRANDHEPHAVFVTSRGRTVFERRTPVAAVEDEWTEAYEPPANVPPAGSAWRSEITAALNARDAMEIELAQALARPSADPELVAERDALSAVMKEAVKRSPEHRADLVAMYRRLKGAA